MNIGIFGNTNNYPYLLALGLRKLGAAVRLVVNRPELLHRPESVSPALQGAYPDWILDCSALPEDDFVAESPSLCNVLNFIGGDARGLVLNHIGPSLAHQLPAPHVSLMTGSDVTYYADYASAELRRTAWSPEFKRSIGGRFAHRRWLEFVLRQRDGIASSNAVSSGLPGLVPEADRLLETIGVPFSRRFFVYLANTEGLPPAPAPKNRVLSVLNGARLNWVQPLPSGFTAQDDKGTDKLIRGFARFVSRGGKARLRLVKKGLHADETRKLVVELGMDGHVEWLEEMSLAAFHQEVARADVVCDQLGQSFPGMAALDALALGRPVLANFRLDIIASHFPEELPVCNARTADEVADCLERLAASAAERSELGERGRAFAEKYLSPDANARKCLEQLGLA